MLDYCARCCYDRTHETSPVIFHQTLMEGLSQRGQLVAHAIKNLVHFVSKSGADEKAMSKLKQTPNFVSLLCELRERMIEIDKSHKSKVYLKGQESDGKYRALPVFDPVIDKMVRQSVDCDDQAVHASTQTE